MERHTRFQSVSEKGINHDHAAMRLWRKAKKFGTWDPDAIDFSQDIQDWAKIGPQERDVIRMLGSLFGAGEEAVTLDILPLLQVMVEEGRLEEEMFLTSFLWEEAKHTELFRRFFDEVAKDHSNLDRFHVPGYNEIFYEKLPAAMNRLYRDPSPVAQAEALTIYNLVVEGILAEMGYRVWYQMLKSNSLMPGIVEGISLVQRDESRHIAYGVFVLSRLVAEHGKPIIDAVNAKMSELTADLLRFADPTAQQSLIGMIFPGLAEGEMPTPEKMPFHMDVNELMDIMMSYLTTASNARLTKVEKSLGRPVDEIIFRQPTMAEETAEAPATD